MIRPSLTLVALVLVSACVEDTKTTHTSATVTSPVAESAIATVHLDATVQTKLGIATGVIDRRAVPRTRLVGGEVVIPPGRTSIVTAPVAGLVRIVGPISPGTAVTQGARLVQLTALAPADRDTRARVSRELAAAEANLAALQLRLDRNKALVDERAGSARAVEEATAARDVARADVDTARARAETLASDPLLADVGLVVRAPVDGIVRALQVADRQIVPAGAALFEVVAVDGLQVRVPLYGGDIAAVDTTVPAQVRHLRDDVGVGVYATFAAGPPTAEPDRATIDRWLTLPTEATFMPGERVLVTVPLTRSSEALVVDTAAIVIDAQGGSWVYRCVDGAAGHTFARTRVDPLRRAGNLTVLARGPAFGSCVVTVGAAELFGSEFPPGH